MKNGGKRKVGRKKVPSVRVQATPDPNVSDHQTLEEAYEGVLQVRSEGSDDGGRNLSRDGGDGQEIGPSGIRWTTEKRRAGDLTEWDRNPRKLTESQAKHLATSIIKFGYVEPIQINSDNRIIGGHMRHRILLQAGLIEPDDLLDVRVPSRLLTDEEYEELAIRLNKNTGSWDYEILSLHFDQNQLRDWGFSPMDFGMIGATGDSPFEPKKMPDGPMKPTNLQPAGPKTCPHCGGIL